VVYSEQLFINLGQIWHAAQAEVKWKTLKNYFFFLSKKSIFFCDKNFYRLPEVI